MTKAMVMMPVDAAESDSSRTQRRDKMKNSQRKVDSMVLVMTA
jgi:hypothetical protein